MHSKFKLGPALWRRTTRFLLQVLDSAGEFGWQLERSGLLGDEVGLLGSGSSFSSPDLGRRAGKPPGLSELSRTMGNLQEKQRKCCNGLAFVLMCEQKGLISSLGDAIFLKTFY